MTQKSNKKAIWLSRESKLRNDTLSDITFKVYNGVSDRIMGVLKVASVRENIRVVLLEKFR